MKVLKSLNIQMVDLRGQYEKIATEIDENIAQVIQSGAFINGPAVNSFANSLAQFLAVKHVIPCANGTDALQIALMALNLSPGDEVITTPFTFVSTAEVIALLGLKPVFVDIKPDTFNLDVGRVEEYISPKTKCIIPVHLFGQGCEMELLLDICSQYKVTLIEDNAQAIGATYVFENKAVQHLGSIGDIGTTSFYPSKNLGAYGDGGAMFTNSDALAKQLKIVANHGQGKKYFYDNIGINSRLDSLQAAILQVKLKYLDVFNQQRQMVAQWYNTHLGGIDEITIPSLNEKSTHIYHQYCIKVGDSRDALKQYLAQNNIPSMIYYPKPLHLQKAYASYGYELGNLPVAEKTANEILALPMHTELTHAELSYICDVIVKFFN